MSARDPRKAPDMRGAVLRRLGLPTERSWSRRAARQVLRGGAVVIVIAGAAAGLRAWQLAVAPPRPPGPTIPAALHHDLDRAWRCLRSLTPAPETMSPREPQEPFL